MILHMLNSLCYMLLHVLLWYNSRGLLYVRGLFLVLSRVLLLIVVFWAHNLFRIEVS